MEQVKEYDFNINWEKDLFACFREAFKPTDNRPIYDWAADHITLSDSYSVNGRFNPSHSPHFKAIFDAYKDPYIREINILAPPRSGKTLIAEICLLHTLAQKNGNILWLQLVG